MPAWDCPLPAPLFTINPYNKSSIGQACSVNMAKCWPRSLLAFMDINTQKISRTWSISRHLEQTSLANNPYVFAYSKVFLMTKNCHVFDNMTELFLHVIILQYEVIPCKINYIFTISHEADYAMYRLKALVLPKSSLLRLQGYAYTGPDRNLSEPDRIGFCVFGAVWNQSRCLHGTVL